MPIIRKISRDDFPENSDAGWNLEEVYDPIHKTREGFIVLFFVWSKASFPILDAWRPGAQGPFTSFA